MNPIQAVMQMMKSGCNPRQLVIQMLSANPNLDAVGQNLLSCAKANDLNGASNIAQNIAREKGIDTNNVFNNFKPK